MRVRIHKSVAASLKSPIMLAGWPGMGHVGLGGISYVRQKLGAEPFAEVDAHEYFTPEAIEVSEGLARFPDIPSNTFYVARNPDVIIFESETQISGDGGIALMNEMLDFAAHHDVSRIFTGAAYAMPVSSSQPSKVLGVANREPIRDLLVSQNVELLEGGSIQGLNGLLLGFAGMREMDAACLLATMPQYAINLPNPKASREIVLVIQRILGRDVDLGDIDEAVGKMSQTMGEIEEKIQSAFLDEAAEADEELKEVDEEAVPQMVLERIERMFGEVALNGSKEKAAALKEELDRWSLYAHYEDRFLDLFRDDESADEK